MIIARIEKLETVSKHPDLGPLGEGLITLMDQKLSHLDQRLYELTTKIEVREEYKQEIKKESKLDQTQKAQIIYLEGEQTKNSSIVGLHNFYVITTYNRNVMYALAVLELGESIEGILSPDVF